MLLQKVSSPINITLTNIHEGPNGLHNVRLHHIFDMNSGNCSGHVNLTCKVGSKDYILMEERMDFCRGKTFWKFNIGSCFIKKSISLYLSLCFLMSTFHFLSYVFFLFLSLLRIPCFYILQPFLPFIYIM